MFLSQNPATGAKRLTPGNLRMSCGMPAVSPVQKGHGRGTADRPYFAVQGTASTSSQVVRLALEIILWRNHERRRTFLLNDEKCRIPYWL